MPSLPNQESPSNDAPAAADTAETTAENEWSVDGPEPDYYVHWPYQFDSEGKPRVTTKKPIRPTEWVIPRTTKPMSRFLEKWLNDGFKRGYLFRVDVLMGQEPDEDFADKYPNNWNEVAKCLSGEVLAERGLLRKKKTNPEAYKAYNAQYYVGCKKALREVMFYYY